MRRPLLYSLLLLLLLLGCILAGLQLGAYDTDLTQILDSFLKYDAENPVHFAIWNLRLPRLLLAILTGASLAFCGYLMQAMVNNALADPYLLGTASGASLGAASCFVFFADLTFL